jgi:hypothetical protein
MAIENPKRFEIVLPAAKQGLAALAADMGMNSAAVAKLSIARMLASHDRVLTGDVAGDPLANFLTGTGAGPAGERSGMDQDDCSPGARAQRFGH